MTGDEARVRGLLRRSVKGGAVAAVATGLQHGIAFATQVVLARLLTPADFGLFALALIAANLYAAVSHLYGDKYLVRAERVDRDQFGLVVTVETALALAAYVLLLLTAPLAARLLGEPGLASAVAILGLVVFYQPLSRPRALFERELDFVRARAPSVAAQVVAGGVAIAMALSGFGFWSIVAWRLLSYLVEAALLWVISPMPFRIRWKDPRRRELKELGLPLIGSGLLIFFYWNVDYYIVGRMLGQTQLGYYWLAFQMSHYLLQIRSTISSVSYPLFARLDETEAIARVFEGLTVVTALFYLIPAVLLIVVGEPLVVAVFGAEWAPATPVLQVFSIVVVLRGASAYWEPILLVFNRPRMLLRLTAANAVVIAGLGPLLTWRFGTVGMASAVLVAMGVMVLIGSRAIRELLDVSVVEVMAVPLLIGLGVSFGILAVLPSTGLLALPWLVLSGGGALLLFGVVSVLAYRPLLQRTLRMIRMAPG